MPLGVGWAGTHLLSYCLQAGSAEAVGVMGGQVSALFFGEADVAAVALGDVAYFAFEGLLTLGAGFCFVLAHNIDAGWRSEDRETLYLFS